VAAVSRASPAGCRPAGSRSADRGRCAAGPAAVWPLAVCTCPWPRKSTPLRDCRAVLSGPVSWPTGRRMTELDLADAAGGGAALARLAPGPHA